MRPLRTVTNAAITQVSSVPAVNGPRSTPTTPAQVAPTAARSPLPKLLHDDGLLAEQSSASTQAGEGLFGGPRRALRRDRVRVLDEYGVRRHEIEQVGLGAGQVSDDPVVVLDRRFHNVCHVAIIHNCSCISTVVVRLGSACA